MLNLFSLGIVMAVNVLDPIKCVKFNSKLLLNIPN